MSTLLAPNPPPAAVVAPGSASSPVPLAERLREALGPTTDLREPTGRLSARRVAELFDLSLSQLAALLGRNKQTVAKTPDAEALQAGLRDFGRVAGLRVALDGNEAFRHWLRTPTRPLEGHSPRELIDAGRVRVVADLVEDMLTGSPA